MPRVAGDNMGVTGQASVSRENASNNPAASQKVVDINDIQRNTLVAYGYGGVVKDYITYRSNNDEQRMAEGNLHFRDLIPAGRNCSMVEGIHFLLLQKEINPVIGDSVVTGSGLVSS